MNEKTELENLANAAIVDHVRKMVINISRKKLDQENASTELKFMSSIIVVDDLSNTVRAKYTNKELSETQMSEFFNAARQFIATVDGILALENAQQIFIKEE